MAAALPRLTVIGTGYLGATHAICMAGLGFDVVGVDVDPGKVQRLSAGEVPFFEPGLPSCSGRRWTRAGSPSPRTTRRPAPSATCTSSASARRRRGGARRRTSPTSGPPPSSSARHIDRRALIVGKSTVPVGTAAELTALVQRVSPAGEQVELAWNPEFLREGFAIEDSMRPDRLVFGVASSWAEAQLRAAFAPVVEEHGTPVLIMDLATAELVKVAANSFLATKISYINAMAEVCEAAGADVTALAGALALDERIGGRFLRPGLGFGGGCLPKDIRAFKHRAEEIGAGDAVVRRSSPTATTSVTRRHWTSRRLCVPPGRSSRCTTRRRCRTRAASTRSSPTLGRWSTR